MSFALWWILGFVSCFLLFVIIGKMRKAQGPNSIVKTKENVVAIKTPVNQEK